MDDDKNASHAVEDTTSLTGMWSGVPSSRCSTNGPYNLLASEDEWDCRIAITAVGASVKVNELQAKLEHEQRERKKEKMLAAELQRKIAEFERMQSGAVQAKVDEIQQQLADTKSQLGKEKDAQIHTLQQQRDNDRREIAALSEFKLVCGQQSKMNVALQEQVKSLQDQLEEEQANAQKYQTASAEAKEKLRELEERLSAGEQQRQSLAAKNVTLTQQLSCFQQQEVDSNAAQEIHNKCQEEWEAKNASLSKQLAQLQVSEQHHLAQQSQFQAQLKDLEAQCFEAKEQSAHHKMHSMSLTHRVEELEGNLMDNEALQEQLASCRQDLAEAREYRDEIQVHRRRAEDLEAELSRGDGIRRLLQDQVSELEDELQRTRAAQETHTETQHTLQQYLADLKQQLQDLSKDRDNHRTQMALIKSQNGAMEEKNDSLIALNQHLAQNNRTLQAELTDLKQEVSTERMRSDQLLKKQAAFQEQFLRLGARLTEANAMNDELTGKDFAHELTIGSLRRDLEAARTKAEHGRLAVKETAEARVEAEAAEQRWADEGRGRQMLEGGQALRSCRADARTARQAFAGHEGQLLEMDCPVMEQASRRDRELENEIARLKAKSEEQHRLLASLSGQTFAAEPAPTIGYKLVAKVGQRYYSLWAGKSVEYIMGETMEAPAQPNYRGGIYFCASAQDAQRVHVPVSHHSAPHNARRVILKCECEGPFVQYQHGKKFACSRLTPVQEVAATAQIHRSASAGATARGHNNKVELEELECCSDQASLPAGAGRKSVQYLRNGDRGSMRTTSRQDWAVAQGLAETYVAN